MLKSYSKQQNLPKQCLL